MDTSVAERESRNMSGMPEAAVAIAGDFAITGDSAGVESSLNMPRTEFKSSWHILLGVSMSGAATCTIQSSPGPTLVAAIVWLEVAKGRYIEDNM